MDAVGGSWAGTLACSVCRKKRLTADSFSANQLRRLRDRKIAEDTLKCKNCVNAAATAERESALEARKSDGTAGSEPLSCSICRQNRPPEDFTNTQARKPDSSRKCRQCSAAAEVEEADAIRAARKAKLSEAQGASAAAAKLPKGAVGAAARLKAASAECALEAEKVTGLKPMVGAGMRGGRGRGRGSWRGRSSSAQRGRTSSK